MQSPHLDVDTLIIGAGPAGLATARELRERGFAPLIIERGDDVGWVWSTLYESLTLHTGKRLSHLPGLPFRESDPVFITRGRFVEYLREYARRFELDVQTGTEALFATRKSERWVVTTNRGKIHCDHLVVATGIVSNPVSPDLAGMDQFHGRIIHSVEYASPAAHLGRRILVVGAGNSGAEIASELATAGLEVTISIRSGVNTVPLTIGGVPIQYIGTTLRKLPRFIRNGVVAAVRRVIQLKRGASPLPPSVHGPLDSIPLIGFHLEDAVRAGKVSVAGAVDRLTEDGVVFADGSERGVDDVILATGYRPALSFLGDLITRDGKGFATRSDRVRSRDRDHLWFVGHNYDSSGGLYNIRIDSALVAEAIRDSS